MIDIIKYFLLVTNGIILVYFAFSSMYFIVFAAASLFYKETCLVDSSNKSRKISLLIPAYKEDNVIVETAIAAVKHKSEKHIVEVFVIADSLQLKTLENLKQTGAKVIPVSFEKSTKAKSMNVALNQIPDDSDVVVIIDADNIMAEGFIDKLMDRMNQGFQVVQGHRTAKNDNTQFAVLDGISEEINNNIFRKGHRTLGLSSAIIGSGFAAETLLFKEIMQNITATGGFDKELEMGLLARKVTVEYADEAIIYDEKVQKSDVFVNQRRRWLSAQFIFFAKNIRKALIELFKHRNFGFLDKTIQFILSPRIIALGVTFLMSLFHLVAFLLFSIPVLKILFLAWTTIFLIATVAVIISIPRNMLSYNLLKSMLAAPKGFILMIKALLNLKGADKQFIHTDHGIQ